VAGETEHIGALLLEEGLLTRRDLDRAVEVQPSTGTPLPRVLVAEGIVAEPDLVRALARHVGLEYVNLSEVNIDPAALVAYDIPLAKVVQAVRQGNNDVGGRLVEMAGREYMVRGLGYVRSVEDIENIVVKSGENGTPVLVRQLGRVELGPDIRRGLSDLNGEGDVVGGTVIVYCALLVCFNAIVDVLYTVLDKRVKLV